MSLRKDDDTKLKEKIEPQFMKSDATRAKEHTTGALDNAASYLPGQSRASDTLHSDARDPHLGHDAGRQSNVLPNSFQPAGNQTVGDDFKNRPDQATSHLQPNDDKSAGQQLHDTVKPGNDSSITPHGHTDTHTEHRTIGERIVGVKDTIANAVGGNSNEPERR